MFNLSFKTLPLLLGTAFVALICSCKSNYVSGPDVAPKAVVKDGVAITLRDQKLTLFKGGRKVKDYDISSSKFGIGSRNGSNHTPTGIHAVAKKVGEGQPSGMVFKACRPTGEVVPVDAAGRDPIVTRVIQIAGLEGKNRNSFSRRIYIHGTPEERNIGRPASYGCIRMRSKDVLDLFSRVDRGTPVAIETCSQQKYMEAEKNRNSLSIAIPQEVVAKLPKDDVSFRPSRSIRRRGMAHTRRPLSSSRKAVASGKKSSSSSKSRSTAVSKKSSTKKSSGSKKSSSKSKKMASTRRKK